MRAQLDLLGTPTGLALSARVRQRNTGIKRAADHADDVYTGWMQSAVDSVRQYALTHASFFCESARQAAEEAGLVLPPDKRAWGSVMRRCAKLRVVKADGYGAIAGTPHTIWVSLIYNT